MLVSQAHSFTQQARLAVTLAWVAGYTNVVAVLTCGMSTSHVTGRLTDLSRDVAQGVWANAILAVYLLVMFLGGAAMSAVLVETGRRRGWRSVYVLPIGVEALLLSAFAAGVELVGKGGAAGWMLYAMTGSGTLAMGLQNATITRISSGVVRTTHMTGVFTDIGLEGVLFLYWLRDRGKDVPPSDARAWLRSVRVHPTARRLALLCSLAGSFGLGAGLGTAGYIEMPRLAMVPPVLFLLWIIYADVRAPICEIEEAGGGAMDEAEMERMQLPAALAVFHLRRDRARVGKMQRLPDLLRWAEKLPREKRVVILDVGEATEFNENAALELRALLLQSAARGRRVVLSGVNGEQFRAMQEAGAGDVLDPTNVCADFELAVARGVMLAELGG